MCEVCGICDVCVATLQRQAYASKGDEGASVRVKPEEEMMDKWNDWSSESDDEREGGGSDDGSAAVRLSLSVSFKAPNISLFNHPIIQINLSLFFQTRTR